MHIAQAGLICEPNAVLQKIDPFSGSASRGVLCGSKVLPFKVGCWSYLWSTSSTYYVFQPYTDQGSPHDRGLPVATRKTTWSYWKIPGKFFLPCNVPMCIFRQLGWTPASHSSQSSWSRVDTRPTWWGNHDLSVMKGREGFTAETCLQRWQKSN